LEGVEASPMVHPVRIDGLNKRGDELFIKDFCKDSIRMNLYQTITDKQSRKAIKQ